MYIHASLQAGNGNTGIGFYFKLIPGCPSHCGPLRQFPLWVKHSRSHLSDEMLACVRYLLANGLKMHVAADSKDSFLINTLPEKGVNI